MLIQDVHQHVTVTFASHLHPEKTWCGWVWPDRVATRASARSYPPSLSLSPSAAATMASDQLERDLTHSAVGYLSKEDYKRKREDMEQDTGWCVLAGV